MIGSLVALGLGLTLGGFGDPPEQPHFDGLVDRPADYAAMKLWQSGMWASENVSPPHLNLYGNLRDPAVRESNGFIHGQHAANDERRQGRVSSNGNINEPALFLQKGSLASPSDLGFVSFERSVADPAKIKSGRLSGIGDTDSDGKMPKRVNPSTDIRRAEVSSDLRLTNSTRFLHGLVGHIQRTSIIPECDTEPDDAEHAQEHLDQGPIGRFLASFRGVPIGAKIALFTGPWIAAWLLFFNALDSLADGAPGRGWRRLFYAFSIVGVTIWSAVPSCGGPA